MSSSWDELVAQIKLGGSAEEALGLKEPLVSFSKYQVHKLLMLLVLYDRTCGPKNGSI